VRVGEIRTDCVKGQLGVFCGCGVEGFPSAGIERGVHVEGDEDGSGKHLERLIIRMLQRKARIEKEGSIDIRIESILGEGF
jgi:hypothetical protein